MSPASSVGVPGHAWPRHPRGLGTFGCRRPPIFTVNNVADMLIHDAPLQASGSRRSTWLDPVAVVQESQATRAMTSAAAALPAAASA